MPMNTDKELIASLKTSFIDGSDQTSKEMLRTLFLSNDPSGTECVRNNIEDELRSATSFAMSVAFVTTGGITPLLLTLRELEHKGIPGRVLTTDYLHFSEPSAIDKLAGLSNIEVRFFRTDRETGFHTKGYIFRRNNMCRIILGSSNLTEKALCTNREWNARIVTKDTGEFASSLLDEFSSLWDSPQSLSWQAVRDEYIREKRAVEAAQREVMSRLVKEKDVLHRKSGKPVANAMQKTFVRNVMRLYHAGEKRGLLISATGTGKTYAAAFAVQAMRPARMLFLVHREQIALQAMKSFSRVLGNGISMGLYTGGRKDGTDTEFIFATVQTMSKYEHSSLFGKEAFDLIVIDEVHRAGAPSYEKIMNYFSPKFWLGMTASPDRPDGVDIYRLFDHNIAYEIRLQTALEENLLCPFHYFGLTELHVNGVSADIRGSFNALSAPERVDHILHEARYYGFSGERVKGLVFCRSTLECEVLSEAFNERGLRTVALTGLDSLAVREKAVYRLQKGEGDNRLDYIFSVDIFNEGIDIPEVNQVILLRPTESPIIFVQQLGRGLRKAAGKNFVVVLDFIGNSETNFMIPIALSGDNSYNKDNMRRFTAVSSRLLPGVSSIHFDEVARERIFRSIDTAKTDDIRLLRSSYQNLKFKLGRIPDLLDFGEHNGIDPTKFFQKKSLGSYYGFLVKYEPEYRARVSLRAEKMLCFCASRFGEAQRISEVLVLEDILNGRKWDLGLSLREKLVRDYAFSPERALGESESVARILGNGFNKTAGEKARNADCVFVEAEDPGNFSAAEAFLSEIRDKEFHRRLRGLIAFVKRRYETRYAESYGNTSLVLYEKYTYEDVCRLLNWTRNVTAQNIGGYFYDKETKTLPVFINYEKADGDIRYEDRFLTPERLIALSKTKRKTDSPDADRIYKRSPDDADNRIYLFVRRNKDDKEAKAFYFLGEVTAFGEPQGVQLPSSEKGGRAVNAFEIDYRLETPVRQDIYRYLTGE